MLHGEGAVKSQLWEYIRKGLSDPLSGLHFLLYGKTSLVQRQAKRLVQRAGMDPQTIVKFYKQIEYSTDFLKAVTEAQGITLKEQRRMPPPLFLYSVVRTLEPEIVVETGVASGVSSAFILKALEDNNKGILYSIDLPGHVVLVHGKETGYVIPHDLRKRWILKVGKSKDILPDLVREVGRIDIFLHDSEHTYENMMFEYSTAWPCISNKGLLLSHDISANNAWRDFCRRVGQESIEIYFCGIGAIVK